mgnify:CR=1 FL=1
MLHQLTQRLRQIRDGLTVVRELEELDRRTATDRIAGLRIRERAEHVLRELDDRMRRAVLHAKRLHFHQCLGIDVALRRLDRAEHRGPIREAVVHVEALRDIAGGYHALSDAGIDVVSSEYATVQAENKALENLSLEVADRIVTGPSIEKSIAPLRSGAVLALSGL